MEKQIKFFNNAEAMINNDNRLKENFNEILEIIKNVSPEMVLEQFSENLSKKKGNGNAKSLSVPVNEVLKREFEKKNWKSEPELFMKDEKHKYCHFKLDFTKDELFSVEVAFNHGEAIAWNILKPQLCCDNRVDNRETKSEVAVIICPTYKFRTYGNVDSSTGFFEKFLECMEVFKDYATAPFVLIGLEPFEDFKIQKEGREVIRRFNPDDISENSKWKGHHVRIVTKEKDTKDKEISMINTFIYDIDIKNKEYLVVSRESYLDLEDRNDKKIKRILWNDIEFIEEFVTRNSK